MPDITNHVAAILEHGVDHVGGRDGARRHAQSVVDQTRRGQMFLDATVQDINHAQSVVDDYIV